MESFNNNLQGGKKLVKSLEKQSPVSVLQAPATPARKFATGAWWRLRRQPHARRPRRRRPQLFTPGRCSRADGRQRPRVADAARHQARRGVSADQPRLLTFSTRGWCAARRGRALDAMVDQWLAFGHRERVGRRRRRRPAHGAAGGSPELVHLTSAAAPLGPARRSESGRRPTAAATARWHALRDGRGRRCPAPPPGAQPTHAQARGARRHRRWSWPRRASGASTRAERRSDWRAARKLC